MLFSKYQVGAVVLTMSLLLSACTDSAAIESKPIQEFLTVEAQQAILSNSYVVSREYVGTVQANQKAQLGFELSGKVSSIYVDVGQEVQEGQALITLDTQLLITEKKQLQAQLNEIYAQLKLTKANLKRQVSLREKGFSSEAEFDSLTSQKDALLANVLRIQSTIAANSLKQSKSIIKAPYSGIVSERFVSLGDVVAVGAPTLVLLSSGNKEATIGVHKDDVKDIKTQNTHTIRIGSTAFNAELISLPSNIETNSRNVRLRFNLMDTTEVLDGELAYLSFQKVFHENGFWLPNSALTDGIRGTWNIYVLVANNNQKIVESRSVEVLYSDSERVYVKGALSSGDDVVVSGLHKVVPGQAVKIAYSR